VIPKPRTPFVLTVTLLKENPHKLMEKGMTRAARSSSWFTEELKIAVGEERTTVGAAVVEIGVVVREPEVCSLHISIVSHESF
jgi:hypothetical protein